MAALRLRDRDAIVTKQGVIFRVLGYSHPRNSYVCDPEYASSRIFRSTDPRAPRGQAKNSFYKFYEDQGYRFIQEKYPQFLILHEMLQRKIVGVNLNDVSTVRKPEETLRQQSQKPAKDSLLRAMKSALECVIEASGLHLADFGVFGSLLHNFYHPTLSDIDLVVYGRKQLTRLRDVLKEFYQSASSPFTNEFETEESIRGKTWRFQNLSPEEYVWHQRRKLIYTLFKDRESGRTIKTEFEPVKNWNEIRNEYDSKTRITPKGWTRISANVIDDSESPFIPSTYEIEPLEVLEGSKSAIGARRVVSYLEEFRLQARRGETVEVSGNLEEVTSLRHRFFQIALTYCPRYYDQTLRLNRKKI